MQQSNVIFACLFIAFIVFITMRGKLPAYLAALLGTSAGASSGSSAGSSSGASGGDSAAGIGDALNDPVGAITGGIRRSLGIGNGLPDVGSILRGGSGLGGAGLFGF